MTPDEAKEELTELYRRLRWWQTEIMIRHAEHPVSFEYANNCIICKGAGQAHFCLTPGCNGDGTIASLEECLHPTPEEIEKLKELHILHKNLTQQVMKEVGATIPSILERLNGNPAVAEAVKKLFGGD